MGRFASLAFAWNKGGADSCSATSAATSENSAAATTAARTARPARTLLRALFAMLVAAATLLAMLILPPVNKAFADEGARWDYGGTGYISGKGFDWADSTRDLSISYPRLWIKDGKKKITWTVTFNKNSYLLAHIRGGKIKIKGKKGYEYLHIEPHSPYNGHSAIPPEGAAWSGDRPLFMVFLPKGINNVSIDRRRTGYDNARYSFARWPYEWGKHGEDLKKWYKRYPEDVVADKLIQCSDGYECKDSAERDRKTQEFLNESWEQSWKKLTLIQNPAVKKSKWKWDKGKIDYDQSIASFDGSDNWNKYNGTHYDRGDGFDTFWNEALGEKRLGSGECTGESCKGYSLAEIKQWKSKFQVVLASWEQQSYAPAMEWKITGDYEDSIKNPELLPLIAGWNSNKTGNNYGDPFPGNKNQWQSKWSFVGPYDTDGDGIPDLSEFYLGTDPTKKTNILYPVYKPKMLNDYPNRSTKSPTDYGGTDNVPVTTYKEPITVKPFVNVGTWNSDTFNPNLFTQDKNADGSNATSTDLHHAIDLPGAENTAYLNMSYAITGVPDGVKNNYYEPCNTDTQDGCVKIDSKTGYITYRPRKDDWKNYPDGLEFKVKVTHINPNIYPYNSDKNKGQAWEEKDVPVKIKVLSNASLYNPHYDETTVNYDKDNNRFNPTDSKEPKSVKDRKKPWVREGALPNGTKFEPKQYTMKIGNKTNPRGDDVLPWSSISKKSPDNTGNGKVTFKPNKSNAGESTHTPVLATYPDGSTSEDTDAGNEGVVYAPVKVEELPVNGGDLHLALKKGTQINNNQFSGWDFSKDKPYELTKGTKIGAPTKEDSNPGNGIVLDSWSTNAKGPITFRAVCHKKNDSKYELLKPAEGKNKASGEINGLKFEEFRQWIRDNDKSCKVKGANCSDDNHYLHPGEYNKDTMERSRALIGGTPEKAGEYECKVFAFHQAHDGKGTQYNEALTKFDTLAKNGANFAFAYGIGDTFTDSKGTEWLSDSFYFKIKLNDNQKYNPTYVKTGTIEAGKFKIGDFVDSNGNSSKQPTSIKNGNGVPTKDQDDIVVDRLPKGTWFEIKRLIKSADKDNNKAKTYPWANLEGDEDNVKRDDKGNPVKKDNKIQPNDTTSIREYGAVTFRPDKWQDAGEYWAEVVVHYPDGTSTDQPESINYNHPVYAKVKVTRDDDNNQFRLDLWKNYPKTRMGNGYDLKVGESLPNDATFDSWMTKSVGNLHQHVVCSKKGKDGKYSDYTYNTLPGHVNNTKSGAKEIEKDGLRFKSEKVWKHASFKQQEQCRIKGGSSCDKDNYLYDGDGASEQTRGYFGGKAQKTGDYECKVYVIRGDDKSAAFEKAVKGNIEKNKKAKKNADPVDGVLNASGNPYGTDGQGYKIGKFDVRIHNDNHFYNPQYNTITLTAGTHGSSAVPSSAQNANGATDNQSDVKVGNLPAGTWFERKMYKSDTSYKSLLSYAVFENGQANTEDKKNAKDTKNAGKFGKVSFYPHKWMNATKEGQPDKVPVVVHYPDGSTSEDPDSGNNGKPIYAYVNIVRPKINNPDLKLELFSRYNDATDNIDGDASRIAASYDSNNNINSPYGVTVMKNLGLIKDLGINAWSENKPGQIGLKLLCKKKGDSNSKWNEKLDKLFFHVSKEKKWGHADSFDKQKPCRENSSNCKADLLYDKDGNTMERSRGKIAGVPTEVGEYQCAVLAVKPDAEKVYSKNLAKPKNNNVGGDSSLNVENPAESFGKLVKNVDWAIVYFPVHVVEPFNLPKTGGEDCVNWNMLMSVVCVLGTGAMAAGFFLDQTKWGRAMLEALLRKALIKAFIRKTAEWCGGVMLRIEWWITERWRC